MKFVFSRKKIVVSLVLIGLGSGIFFIREVLAEAIFKKTGSARVALLFERNDATLWFEAGNYYFGGGYNPTKAMDYYSRALELNPSLPGLHYQIARIYFLEGSFKRALFEVDQEIFLRADFRKSYYMKGLIQGYADDLEGAEKNFKKFISLDSYNWAGYNDLAWIYFKQGKYQAAKGAAEEGLSRAAENPWLENSLGLALLNLGDKEKARAYFEAALKHMGTMTPEAWGKAYPGNDPLLHDHGLREMKKSIADNLELSKKGVDTPERGE